MVKQLILPLLGVAAFIILVGLLVKNSGNIVIPGVSTPVPTSSSLPKEMVKIGNIIISVEEATTESEREKGLSGRSSLDKNSGMLFIFDKKGVNPGFWMKGMLIPLDIIWISDNKVVKIDKNIQPPAANAADASLTIYNPGRSIDYVLEVNSGFSDSMNIAVGSYFEFVKNLQ